MQSKTHSIIEALVNVAVGYLLAVASGILIFPLFDIDIPVSDNFLIALWFTAVSISRSYCLRRVFTRRTEQ